MAWLVDRGEQPISWACRSGPTPNRHAEGLAATPGSAVLRAATLGSMAEKARTTVKGPRSDQRRRVPSIDALLRSEPGKKAAAKFGRPVLKHALQTALTDVREAAARGAPVPADD